jgi:hypothetical protein
VISILLAAESAFGPFPIVNEVDRTSPFGTPGLVD